MTDKEYEAACAALFAELEAFLENAGADFDNNGGVLEIVSDAGGDIIINRQAAKHEVWLAAKSGGRHFRLSDGEWRDTRDNSLLTAQLRALLGA